MINEVFLVSYGYYNGVIGDVLNQWAEMGFFSYVLPFLLIFAMVFGILSTTNIFRGNRMVDAIIALVVGLMALQFDFVPVFFAQVFPRLGVALSVLLVIIILIGLFIDPSKGWLMYTLMGVGIIAAIVVLVSTSGSVGWASGYWFSENWATIAFVVFFFIAMAVIIGTTNKNPRGPYKRGPFP
ncbi:MAG: hypothetical protein Q7R52_04975 [archaeon]|nr:hypothetical protein [archaeon]